MKKYTQASTKGFTLVELIVVIVILAILSTIAFLSFSSQSASARDSKRKTDLSNIASKMNISAAQGVAITNMITANHNQELTSGNLAGTVANNTTITAGTLNFATLGINGADFADPLGDAYVAASTKYAGGVFQLASKIENDESGNPISSGAVLVGNYSAREIDSTTGTGTSTLTGTIILNDALVGQFKTKDTILFNSNTGTISSVSADQKTIKVTGTSIGIGDGLDIQLVGAAGTSEVSSLIMSADGTNPVDTTHSPY
ncbi:MAG: prepilin-type N-terminal cleavage/methylation domain-containing protein [Candidatus Gracilibacteria bacterium]|nr:prepilin-type N-terminal cleavage/methylation domain-containing protein [Candidatus Gracilibacteria bacterium]